LIGDDQPAWRKRIRESSRGTDSAAGPSGSHLLPQAVQAVSIEYDPLPAIFTIEESERRAEIVWGEDNIFKTY
jgi:hypothetical protein